MLRRVALVQALAVALLLLVAGGAGAHTSAPMLSAPVVASSVTAAFAEVMPPASIAAATPRADTTLWPWLALLALVPVLGRRRAPRLLAAALVLVLVVFAAESAVHSVHHGIAGDGTAVCPVASAAAHVAGSDLEAVAAPAPAPAAGPALTESGPLSTTPRPLGQHQGRAPPSALAS
jgi:hypothetical protein